MPQGNMFGGMPPSNNSLWVGNNYSQGMPRNSYPAMNQNDINSMQPQTMGQVQSINNILQVMGPESAQAYQVGPNSKVILMDSSRPVFYMKRTDSSGYPETRAYSFQEIPLFQSQTQPQQSVTQTSNEAQTMASLQNYVTKSEFEEFKKMIEELVMKSE